MGPARAFIMNPLAVGKEGAAVMIDLGRVAVDDAVEDRRGNDFADGGTSRYVDDRPVPDDGGDADRSGRIGGRGLDAAVMGTCSDRYHGAGITGSLAQQFLS